MPVVPIFPLGQVLMPGRPLPLHIFEPRYRTMIADLAEPAALIAPSTPTGVQFGVVLLSRGIEVNSRWAQAPDPEAAGTIAAIGTLAEVMEMRPTADGGFDLLAVGSRRFRISSWVRGKSYAQAEVEFLDEQDGDVPAGLAEDVISLFSEHVGMLTARTGRAPSVLAELPRLSDPNLLSYFIGAALPLDEQNRQALLAEPDAARRLARGRALLRRELGLFKRTNTVSVSYDALRLAFGPN
ncbi:MAG TPA: LON peptidase substrate-binding domain-containing protein [Jatrophihabitans sp.]|jgi:hypothetical protein